MVRHRDFEGPSNVSSDACLEREIAVLKYDLEDEMAL